MMAFLVWFSVTIGLFSLVGFLMGYKPDWFYRTRGYYLGNDRWEASMKDSTIAVLIMIPLWPFTIPTVGVASILLFTFYHLTLFFKKQGAKRIPQ